MYSLKLGSSIYHLDIIRDDNGDAAVHQSKLGPLAPARARRGNAEGGPLETLPEVFVTFLLKVSGAFAWTVLEVLAICLQNAEVGVVGVVGGFGEKLD